MEKIKEWWRNQSMGVKLVVCVFALAVLMAVVQGLAAG
jgi:hypothetical protein